MTPVRITARKHAHGKEGCFRAGASGAPRRRASGYLSRRGGSHPCHNWARACPVCFFITGPRRLDFEVTMPPRWSRQHTVTVALALVVLLIWALVYKLFLD